VSMLTLIPTIRILLLILFFLIPLIDGYFSPDGMVRIGLPPQGLSDRLGWFSVLIFSILVPFSFLLYSSGVSIALYLSYLALGFIVAFIVAVGIPYFPRLLLFIFLLFLMFLNYPIASISFSNYPDIVILCMYLQPLVFMGFAGLWGGRLERQKIPWIMLGLVVFLNEPISSVSLKTNGLGHLIVLLWSPAFIIITFSLLFVVILDLVSTVSKGGDLDQFITFVLAPIVITYLSFVEFFMFQYAEIAVILHLLVAPCILLLRPSKRWRISQESRTPRPPVIPWEKLEPR